MILQHWANKPLSRVRLRFIPGTSAGAACHRKDEFDGPRIMAKVRHSPIISSAFPKSETTIVSVDKLFRSQRRHNVVAVNHDLDGRTFPCATVHDGQHP